MMSETNWTPDQQNAIDSRGGTLLLSAAAGSGKTAVLVERIIKLLTDKNSPVEPGELLVVTFTNAAAAEMRARITAAVDKLIAAEPSNSFYRNIKMKLPEARISTMDSFCISLVRENFHAAGIEPDFELLDSGEERILVAEAMSRMLDAMCSEDAELYELLNTMTSYRGNDESLSAKVESLYNFSLSHPFPEKWLNEAEKMYEDCEDLKDSLWGKLIIDEAKVTAEHATCLVKNAIYDVAGYDIIEEKYRETLEQKLDLLGRISDMIEKGTWDEICSFVRSISWDRLPTAPRGYGDDPIKVAAEMKHKEAGTVIMKLPGIFCADTKEHAEDMERLRPVMHGLVGAVRNFSSIYRELKNQRNSYTFTDIMHFALELLVESDGDGIKKTELAKSLQNGYGEILIDEYQDTNEAQDMLFSVLSKDGTNMFMVGDVKQSIYRFRLAMPEIFMKKSREFADYNGKDFPAKIFLGQNFRSRKGVLDNINFLFKNLMTEYAGEMEYTDRDALYYSDVYKQQSAEPDVSLRFLEGYDTQGEAEYIAELIEKTVKSGAEVTVKGETRKVGYGDFCILLRSMRSKAEVYEDALRRRNIKTVYDKRSSLFDTTETGVFMSLLKVINNPTDDVSLLAVMFSPLYGFTVDEIAQIKLYSKEDNLYTNLKKSAESDEKSAKLLCDITSYRQKSAVLPFDVFVRTLLDATGYMAIVSALRGGEERKMNLMLLSTLAAEYTGRGGNGIGGFIRYINNAAENNADISAAATGVSDGNAVRIMSIHKSKGLEFPYVILADCGKRINKSDTAEDMIISPLAGVGMVLINSEKLQKYSSVAHMAAKLAVKRAMVSEELRILYVAMTRAREKLIAVSCVSDMIKELNAAAVAVSDGKISPLAVINASTYTKLLLMGFLRHPDMAALLDEADIHCDADIKNADSRLSVVVEESQTEKSDICEDDAASEPDEEIIRELRKRAEYEYPYIMPADARPKRVASEFEKKIFNEKYFAKSKPSFMCDGKLTAAQAGTANHLFLQNLDFSAVNVENECERMVQCGILTRQQADAVRKDRVEAFMKSSLFSRIKNADAVYREKDFAVQIRLGDIDKDVHESVADEMIMIRGKADLVFEENGKIVIVDYKTDRGKTEEEFAEAYAGQLDMYKRGIGQITDMPVAETSVYSLDLGKEIKI